MATSWSYKNIWIYILLYRMRTLGVLFICKKLSALNSFLVDPKLIQEEEHIRGKENELIYFLENNREWIDM